MAMNDTIIADLITAVTINGTLIKAGSVNAESLFQEYKQSVTDSINDVAINVTQAFQAADGQLLSTISATYLTKNSAPSTYATKSALTQITLIRQNGHLFKTVKLGKLCRRYVAHRM